MTHGINTGVDEQKVFSPARRTGMIFHLAVLALLLGVGAAGLWQANKSGFDFNFFIYLLPIFTALLGVPFLVYQAYSLLTASYIVERDGLRLRWGMRSEDIPENQVLWVRSQDQFEGSLPLPFLRWPGAVLGVRRLADGREIEYMSAGRQNLVLIGTAQKIFIISPRNPQEFLFTYQRFAEVGSLTPLVGRSVFPTFFLSHFWSDQAARWLLVAGALYTFTFLALTAWIIPSFATVNLHIELANTGADVVPAVRLLLLPVMNAAIFVADLVLGVFFYRRIETRVLSYLVWGSSLLVSLLFSGAVVIILWKF